MNVPLFSIIIPVYNAEKYLPICMESLLQQTYKSFEVLLINDGSTDDSGNLCDKYASRDDRIRVFHCNNQGAGCARNVGLDYAVGQYILFVDSDDWLETDTLAIFVQSLKSYDWLIGCSHNCYFNQESLSSVKVDYFYPESTYHSKSEVRQMYVEIATNGVSHAPHNKVYKREIIEKYRLRFPSRPKYEDLAFNNAYVDKIDSLVIINEHTYNYRVSNLEGVAQKLPSNMFEIFIDVNNELINLLKSWGVYHHREQRLLKSQFMMDTASCINNTYNPNLTYTFYEKYRYIKMIVENRKVRQSCSGVKCSKFVNIIVRLIRIRAILLIMGCYSLKYRVRQVLTK